MPSYHEEEQLRAHHQSLFRWWSSSEFSLDSLLSAIQLPHCVLRDEVFRGRTIDRSSSRAGGLQHPGDEHPARSAAETVQ